MSKLGKRLDALEQIAAEVRLRPFRELADEHGIAFEEFMRIFEQVKAETAALRARGLDDDEILALKAAEQGIEPDQLRREADELLARFN